MLFVLYFDLISKDSGFSGLVKRKDKYNNNDDLIIVIYYLWGEFIFYRILVFGKFIIFG